MSALQHSPGTTEVAPGLWKPTCGCGWYSKGRYETKESVALAVAEQHATLKGCGKSRFTDQQAQQILIEAKMSRGLHGVARRREQRAYRCPACPGDTWHLTSQPQKETQRR